MKACRPLRCFFLLAACLAGCTTDLHIYTTGSFKALPREGTVVAVHADHPAAGRVAASWLEDRGVIVVTPFPPPEATPSDTQSLTPTQTVLIDTARLDKPIGLAVSIRSLSLDRQEEQWEATAQQGFTEHPAGDVARTAIEQLTCHALATVWRYRPGGYALNSSLDLCAVHQ